MAGHICIARIGAAHGVRGAVKLWTFTEDPLAVKVYGPLLQKTARDRLKSRPPAKQKVIWSRR